MIGATEHATKPAAKRFAGVQASLALKGYVLTYVDDANRAPYYFVARWNLSRSFDALTEVEKFARTVGAVK